MLGAKGRGLGTYANNGARYVVVGRPIIMGHALDDRPDAFLRWVEDQSHGQGLASAASDISPRLSGMFAIFEFNDDGVSVLSDQMGFRPVYIARAEDGRLLGMGTHVESLAHACGLSSDIDLVSLAEMFTHNHISFPYTTRRSIRELEPCSITSVQPGSSKVESRVLWEPTEPERFPDESQARSMLRSALLQAGDDLTRGTERAAVLLSGGMDSRAVLASIPEGRVCTALTYVTRENRETRIAGQVARAKGVDQMLVERGEDYFPELIARGLALLGMELRGNCHGMCLSDRGLCDRFDVVIGGQLSDTLLKDHFMPFQKRDTLRRVRFLQRCKRALLGKRPPRPAGPGHTTGRALLEQELVPEIAKAVRERRSLRLEQVQRVRPTTADEWHRFWPCSRQDDSAHTLGNSRLMCSDTLFAHRSIVEASSMLDPRWRVDGWLADEVFLELCGPLAEIDNANTGLPANAKRSAVSRAAKQAKKNPGHSSGEAKGDWNNVQTSWVNPVEMQKHAPFWIENRARLVGSEHVRVLDSVIGRGVTAMIGSYQDDLPSTANHIAMQMALWLDGLGELDAGTKNGTIEEHAG